VNQASEPTIVPNMGTKFGKANGIDICYETFGDPKDPALLLVMGFTAQLIAWDEAFCIALAKRGRYVIRFDNRDCGLSTHLDGVNVDIPAVLAASEGHGQMPPVPYTLSTFSDDAFGLIDHLGIAKAHIFGASMGGMIVQTMAVEHPERVLSLTSVMSTTGEPDYFKADPAAIQALMTPPPTERDAFIPFSVDRGALFSSPRYYDRAKAAERAGESFDRAFYPEGASRQLAAIRASADRSAALRQLNMPTLVIHGRADKLILPIGGERTAELIAGANLMVLNDMGHDLPEPLWPLIIDATISHTTHAIGAR
jgi:pimeloyl-ACP methyl ester carboxylesterase